MKIKTLGKNHCFFFSFTSRLASVLTSRISHSPNTQIPALHTSNNDVIQKNEIDCPISNQDPKNRDESRLRIQKVALTSVGNVIKEGQSHACKTVKIIPNSSKNDIDVPSVRLIAMRKSENGGKLSLEVILANAAAKMIYGDTFLNI